MATSSYIVSVSAWTINMPVSKFVVLASLETIVVVFSIFKVRQVMKFTPLVHLVWVGNHSRYFWTFTHRLLRIRQSGFLQRMTLIPVMSIINHDNWRMEQRWTFCSRIYVAGLLPARGVLYQCSMTKYRHNWMCMSHSVNGSLRGVRLEREQITTVRCSTTPPIYLLDSSGGIKGRWLSLYHQKKSKVFVLPRNVLVPVADVIYCRLH